MSLKLSMGCMGCEGLEDESKCSCVMERVRRVQDIDTEILRLRSLKAKVSAMGQIIDVLEQMTNTSIDVAITNKEDC